MKQKLLGKTLDELKALIGELGLPAYNAGQIAMWLYQKRVKTIDEMTNLSKKTREMLNENYEVGQTEYAQKFISKDGTQKYLFKIPEANRYIEAVMIPEYEDGTTGNFERATLCVSSQVGCKMNCQFCMTGRGGYHGNLDTAEIISQFICNDQSEELTNAVFMGMGEPLDNWDNVKKALEIITSDWGFGWSPKRITLSSVGVIPNLEKFLNESRCHLAISLHNPFDSERAALMPVQKAYKLEDVISLIKKYDFTGQRRVSFEYIMFAGVNDTKRHSSELIKILKGLECRMNLIRFHTIPDSPLHTSSMQTIEEFKKRLNNAGIITTLRASRGEDIMAACGLLAGKEGEKDES